MHGIVYYGFNARCINMYMSLNGIEHMYTVTARLHWMIYVIFHVRCINMPMSLNGTKHVYIITVGLHMMIYIAVRLKVLICLCYPKLWNAFMWV
jgi:hypothetical protein